RTINRQHRHHLVIRPRPLGTALHYRPSRPPHRKGKSLRKGRITVRASPVHALFQDSRCQIAPVGFEQSGSLPGGFISGNSFAVLPFFSFVGAAEAGDYDVSTSMWDNE